MVTVAGRIMGCTCHQIGCAVVPWGYIRPPHLAQALVWTVVINEGGDGCHKVKAMKGNLSFMVSKHEWPVLPQSHPVFLGQACNYHGAMTSDPCIKEARDRKEPEQVFT